jgi:60S ribosomal export protein NMD3
MEGEFCVLCGRTDRPLEEGVCAECFARTHALVGVADHPRVVLCPSCGARLVGSHWERRGASPMLSSEDLMPWLRPRPEVGIRRAAWEETGRNPLVREMRARIGVRFRGSEREVAVEFPVQVEHRTCPDCSRRSGHYYTALLQLRGPEGRSIAPRIQREERVRLQRLWQHALPEARAEWRRALSWEEERPEGWDVYFVDTVAARGLARWLKTRLGGRLSESPTLYGRKDGRDLYRVTFCLRVPRPGAPEAGRAARRPLGASPAPATVERAPVER